MAGASPVWGCVIHASDGVDSSIAYTRAVGNAFTALNVHVPCGPMTPVCMDIVPPVRNERTNVPAITIWHSLRHSAVAPVKDNAQHDCLLFPHAA